jgi:hypothetical protein
MQNYHLMVALFTLNLIKPELTKIPKRVTQIFLDHGPILRADEPCQQPEHARPLPTVMRRLIITLVIGLLMLSYLSSADLQQTPLGLKLVLNLDGGPVACQGIALPKRSSLIALTLNGYRF